MANNDLSGIVRQGYAEALEIAEDQVQHDDISNVLHLLEAIGVRNLAHIRYLDPEDLKDSLKALTNKVAKGKILSKLTQKGNCSTKDGWRRDLLRECVEPNPGPSFDEIRKQLEEVKLKTSDKVQRWKAVLDKFEQELVAQNPALLGFDHTHVRKAIEDDQFMRTVFGEDNMKLAKGYFEETLLSYGTKNAIPHSLGQVNEDTFPPLGPRVIASSTPAMPSEKLHLPAKIKEASFRDEFPLPAVAAVLQQLRGIWGMKHSSNLQWSHEVEIQTFVEFAIRDVLKMYGIDATLAREVSVAQLRPDFWVVKLWGIPIGAIEVKIPLAGDDDTSTLRDERAAGQVLDYLLTLRSSVGLCGPVFAILTTYRSWRIFWLRSQASKAEETPTGGGLTNRFNELSVSDTSGGQEIADSAHTYEPTNYSGLSFVESLWQQFRQTDSLSSDCEDTAGQSFPATPRKRSVFADSTLYSIDDSATLREVVSKALRLMVLNSVHRQPVSLHRNLFLAANERQWLWIDPLPTTFQLRPDKFPNNNTQQIILLADLGSGLHGRVWLACSTGGAVCVVKFFKEDNIKESSPEKELGFWRKIYPHSKARIQTFMDKPALLMPAFPPCPLAQRSTPEVRAAVQRAVDGLLSKGISHGDLKWANFGFYGSGDTLVAHAFDFGGSHEFAEAGKEEATQKATAQLAEMFAYVAQKA